MSRLFTVGISMIATASFCACSLVSGWSDLQGGRPVVQGGKDKDSSTPDEDATTSPDGSVEPSRDSGPSGVICGAAQCPTGQACCLSTGAKSGQLQCSTRADCDAMSGRYLTCTRASSCPASAPLCCFSYNEGASCFAACAIATYELCSPSDRTPCSTGLACTGTAPGFNNIPACESGGSAFR